MKFFRHSLVGMGLAALALALLGLAVGTMLDARRADSIDNAGGPPAQEAVVSVRVIPIQPQTLTPRMTAFGDIRARRTVQIRPASGGRVVWVSPDLVEGGIVDADAPLVRLDAASARSDMELAEAELAAMTDAKTQAAAALNLAQDALKTAQGQVDLRATALERQRDLLARGAGSASAIEAAELAESSARQGVLSARQSLLASESALADADAALRRQSIALNDARRALNDTEIRAPFAGAISAVTITTGGQIGANDTLAVVIDPAQLDLWMRLSTEQFTRLLQADGTLRPARVTMFFEAGRTAPRRATGRIERASISRVAGEAGRVITAALDPGSPLRPGDFVAVSVEETPIPMAVQIPSRAIGTDGTVLALTPDSRLEAIPVTILRRQGNDVIVDATPLAGRDIVSIRTPQLGAGINVQPLRIRAADADRISLNDTDRARLIAWVQADASLSDADRLAYVSQLSQPEVSAVLVDRLTRLSGG
jgi:multidrug efflux pump subunit AcrA (membrane-fusion protein)